MPVVSNPLVRGRGQRGAASRSPVSGGVVGTPSSQAQRSTASAAAASYASTSIGVSTALLFILYPGIMRQVLMVFNTYGDVIGGETYLTGDFAVSTSDPQYTAVWATALVAVVVYLVGIPASALYLLYRRRSQLADPSMRDTYAMLYAGYRLQGRVYLWEGVVLARKVSFAFLSVFMSNGFLQAHIGLALLCVSLMMHLTVRPFSYAVANSLETASLGVSAFCLMGLLYLSSQQQFDSLWSSRQLSTGSREFSTAQETTADQFPVNIWLHEGARELGAAAMQALNGTAAAASGVWTRYLPAVDAAAAFDYASNVSVSSGMSALGWNETFVGRVGGVTMVRESMVVGVEGGGLRDAPGALLAAEDTSAQDAVNINASAREIGVVILMIIAIVGLLLAYIFSMVRYAVPSASKKVTKLSLKARGVTPQEKPASRRQSFVVTASRRIARKPLPALEAVSGDAEAKAWGVNPLHGSSKSLLIPRNNTTRKSPPKGRVSEVDLPGSARARRRSSTNPLRSHARDRGKDTVAFAPARAAKRSGSVLRNDRGKDALQG
ncbi:Contig2763.g2965 [Symbiodinium sp. KB8]|nr:Contig2763.g2965 [Symbiodinium sp. KB8]